MAESDTVHRQRKPGSGKVHAANHAQHELE